MLDELVLAGEIQETSKKNVLKAITAQDLLQEVRMGISNFTHCVGKYLHTLTHTHSFTHIHSLTYTFSLPRSLLSIVINPRRSRKKIAEAWTSYSCRITYITKTLWRYTMSNYVALFKMCTRSSF